MTPVAHDRLRAGQDIAAVLRARRQRAGHLAVVHVRARRTDGSAAGTAGPARVAVVASRRVGGAVERNRAKRLLREAARHVPFAAGTDVVLVARASCADSAFAPVHREVSALADHLQVVSSDDHEPASAPRTVTIDPDPAVGPTPSGTQRASVRRERPR